MIQLNIMSLHRVYGLNYGEEFDGFDIEPSIKHILFLVLRAIMIDRFQEL